MELELTPDDEEVSVTVSLDRLYAELGNQGILGDEVDGREFIYLAALALEAREKDNYDINDTLMEFIRNSGAVDTDLDDADDIEVILR